MQHFTYLCKMALLSCTWGRMSLEHVFERVCKENTLYTLHPTYIM